MRTVPGLIQGLVLHFRSDSLRGKPRYLTFLTAAASAAYVPTEEPGSAGKLRYILEWAWDKVVHSKEELDNICE